MQKLKLVIVDAGSAWWYAVPAVELEWIDLRYSTS